MSWSKIKNAIIVFLVILNMALGFILYFENSENCKIDENIIDLSVSLLEKNNIKAPKDIFPKSTVDMKSLTLSPIYTNSGIFNNKDIDVKITEIDSSNYIFRYPSGKLYLHGLSFEFIPNESAPKIIQHDLVNKAKNLLISMGFDLKNAKYEKSDDLITFTQTYEGFEVFSSKIYCYLKDGEISYIKGNWGIISEGEKKSTNHISMVIPLFINDEKRAESSTEIVSFTLGYSTNLLAEGEGYNEIEAIPAWRIKTADNKEYFYDAIK